MNVSLTAVIEQLETWHGKQKPPSLTGPFEMILWENVVYLADDRKRRAAFEALRSEIGLDPDIILAASSKSLLAVTRIAGILPQQQVEKLRHIAQVVRDEFAGNLD